MNKSTHAHTHVTSMTDDLTTEQQSLLSCDMMSGDADVVATLRHKAAYYWMCLLSVISSGYWLFVPSITLSGSLLISVPHAHVCQRFCLMFAETQFYFHDLQICGSLTDSQICLQDGQRKETGTNSGLELNNSGPCFTEIYTSLMN